MLEDLIQYPAPVFQEIGAAGFTSVLEQFAATLRSGGYAGATISFYTQGAVHFGYWAARQHLGPSQIREEIISSFLLQHLSSCDCPFAGVRQHHTVRAALGIFGRVLGEALGQPSDGENQPTAIDLELRRFDDYMRMAAGLQEATRLYRRRYVREFLQEFFVGQAIDLFRLEPRDVMGYLSKQGPRLKPASTKVLATSLRSYFRFLRLQGRCEEALILAVPAPSSPRLAALPTVLTDEELERLLTAYDRRTVAGRRDYAIARCLIDLGLRTQEAARLRLDDIDWRKGTLRITGSKSRRDDEPPLTAQVGAAIAVYLRRGRPQTSSREVFLSIRPPVGQAMNRHTICNSILRAAARAGLAGIITGTRILRQTAATRMLRRGASLKEVADVLRHRSLDTTAIYTKIDLPRLATVALPWPEEEP